jgi:hypothetical protein
VQGDPDKQVCLFFMVGGLIPKDFLYTGIGRAEAAIKNLFRNRSFFNTAISAYFSSASSDGTNVTFCSVLAADTLSPSANRNI